MTTKKASQRRQATIVDKHAVQRLVRYRSGRQGRNVMKQFKVIIEKHTEGYISYPLGLKGVVIGAGDTYDEALADVKSAIRFHIDTFGEDVLETDSPVLEAFVTETD